MSHNFLNHTLGSCTNRYCSCQSYVIVKVLNGDIQYLECGHSKYDYQLMRISNNSMQINSKTETLGRYQWGMCSCVSCPIGDRVLSNFFCTECGHSVRYHDLICNNNHNNYISLRFVTSSTPTNTKHFKNMEGNNFTQRKNP